MQPIIEVRLAIVANGYHTDPGSRQEAADR